MRAAQAAVSASRTQQRIVSVSTGGKPWSLTDPFCNCRAKASACYSPTPCCTSRCKTLQHRLIGPYHDIEVIGIIENNCEAIREISEPTDRNTSDYAGSTTIKWLFSNKPFPVRKHEKRFVIRAFLV